MTYTNHIHFSRNHLFFEVFKLNCQIRKNKDVSLNSLQLSHKFYCFCFYLNAQQLENLAFTNTVPLFLASEYSVIMVRWMLYFFSLSFSITSTSKFAYASLSDVCINNLRWASSLYCYVSQILELLLAETSNVSGWRASRAGLGWAFNSLIFA